MSRDRSIYARLTEHFQGVPASLPFVGADLAPYEHPNLHLALESLLPTDARLLGIVDLDYDLSLSRLTIKHIALQFLEGPVEYFNIALGIDQQLACVKKGLYLFSFAGEPMAAMVGPERYSHPPKLKLEVMARSRPAAERFLREALALTRQGQVYRGRVLSIERDCNGGVNVKFHQIPPISRGDIILPEAVLERLERHTVTFSEQVERLRGAGRHLKRGILLHGPPGTGKTLSAMYLASRMPTRTVILITGGGMGSIETACQLARMLQPATVVLEDVDLIGTRREYQMVDANALLFELLNQMDGLGDDADVLFILSTNRPDILEPALASRPGRIDQAIEIPLPDADCRQRLIERYAVGLDLQLSKKSKIVERTAGASAALIRELLRKAALLASLETPPENTDRLAITDRHLDAALVELVVAGGDLTKSLLGAASTQGRKRTKRSSTTEPRRNGQAQRQARPSSRRRT